MGRFDIGDWSHSRCSVYDNENQKVCAVLLGDEVPVELFDLIRERKADGSVALLEAHTNAVKRVASVEKERDALMSACVLLLAHLARYVDNDSPESDTSESSAAMSLARMVLREEEWE